MGKPAYAECKSLDIVFAHDAINNNVANVLCDFIAQRLISWNRQYYFRESVSKGIDNITRELLAPNLTLNDI